MLRGITEDDYIKSLGPEQILNSFWTQNYDTLYELCTSGQSGALFYYTKNRKFMLKTVPKREFHKMRSILKHYFAHTSANKESLISPFFGMHKVEWDYNEGQCGKRKGKQKRYFVVMDNIFKNFKIGNRFDLKGSS